MERIFVNLKELIVYRGGKFHLDGSVYFMKEYRLVWALVLSGLLHLLFFLLYPEWREVTLFSIPDENGVKEGKRIQFEIIETPEESRSEDPPEEASLLSDKNALARDLERNDLENRGLPYSEGFVDAKLIPSMEGSGGRESSIRQRDWEGKKSSEGAEGFEHRTQRFRGTSPFSREYLLGRRGGSQNSYQQPVYEQREFSAEELGGISFNTYAWNFAPYLLELKQRIARNIYPPPAFTRLGFGGENVLQFRITLDGHLEGPQVLEYSGEKALIETSKKAIQVSAPFRPLPEDFPEKYLQVTARFQYFILGKR